MLRIEHRSASTPNHDYLACPQLLDRPAFLVLVGKMIRVGDQVGSKREVAFWLATPTVLLPARSLSFFWSALRYVRAVCAVI